LYRISYQAFSFTELISQYTGSGYRNETYRPTAGSTSRERYFEASLEKKNRAPPDTSEMGLRMVMKIQI
jgi:hypothetical protein